MVPSLGMLQATALAVLVACEGVSAFQAAPPGTHSHVSAAAARQLRRVSTSSSTGTTSRGAPAPTNAFFLEEGGLSGTQASSGRLFLRPVTLNTRVSGRAPGHPAGTADPASTGLGECRRLSRPYHNLRLTVGSGAVDLADRLQEGLPFLAAGEQAELQRALAVALKVHSDAAGTREGRERAERAVEVCLILGELEMDVDALLAALLAGTLSPERGPLGSAVSAGASPKDLARRFGRRVVRLVESFEHVTRLMDVAQTYMAQRVGEGSSHESEESAEQLESLRNLILSEAADWRVVILRVASHLQRMRRPSALRTPAELRSLAHEALGVHAPLAHRLGIHQLVAELQDRAFAQLYPRQNAEVRAQMAARREVHAAVLDRATTALTAALEADDSFMSQVESVSLAGRTKGPYSMWRKTLRSGLAVADVTDAVALRVVFRARRAAGESDADFELRSASLSYDAMRIVQGLYPMLAPRFKDYVSAPKPNGYRSLHATALMPCDRDPDAVHPFEVQVRSYEMHQQAEFGVAAHWGYKGEGSTELLAAAAAPAARTAVVATATALPRPHATGRPKVKGSSVPADIADGRAFVNWLHEELQARKVFVFGPDGLIWDLDKSATAADIARRISICNFYSRARGRSSVEVLVQGHQVPHEYRLRNGDAISVMA